MTRHFETSHANGTRPDALACGLRQCSRLIYAFCLVNKYNTLIVSHLITHGA